MAPDFGIGEAIAAMSMVGAEVGGDALAGGGMEALAGGAEAGLMGGAEAGMSGIAGMGADALGGAGLMGGDALGGLEALGFAPSSVVGDSFGVVNEAIGSGAFDPIGANFNASAFAGPQSGGSFPAMAGGGDPLVTAMDPLSSAGGGGVAGDPLSGGSGVAGTGTSLGQSASGGGSMLDKLVGGATNSVTNNPLGTAAAAAGLGMSLMGNKTSTPNTNALGGIAGNAMGVSQQQTAAGQQLQSYLQNGTLPPGMQQQVSNAVQAAKAKIISNHAAQGMPTDPSKNSALAQELNGVDMKALEMTSQLEQQLLASGTSMINAGIAEAGLASDSYKTLIQIDQQNNKDMGAAISNFASALSGGSRGGVNLRIG